MRTVYTLALVLLASPVAAQPRAAADPVPGWDAFTRLFDGALGGDSIVGASALVVRDGRVVAHHELGFADRARGQRVTERTLFHYGSITKTLTAIAVMQLRDRGKLALDDKITRWVPELRQVHDPFGGSSIDGITIRMLLSHSAGFQDPTWPYTSGKPWEPFEPTSWSQLVAMMPYQELRFPPGSRYGYSNPGFIYLARVIEQISGDPWETYIQKNIFAPLGLDRSYFGVTPYWLADDRSANYTVRRDSVAGSPAMQGGRPGGARVVDNGREFDPGITIPNGGWNAPLADLGAYIAFLTNATRGDTALRRRYDVVLPRATLEEMWRGVVASGDGPSPGDSVGLSFFVVRRGGTRLVGHTGSQAGFLAFLYINPATATGIIVAMNTNPSFRGPRVQSSFERVRQAALVMVAGGGR